MKVGVLVLVQKSSFFFKKNFDQKKIVKQQHARRKKKKRKKEYTMEIHPFRLKPGQVRVLLALFLSFCCCSHKRHLLLLLFVAVVFSRSGSYSSILSLNIIIIISFHPFEMIKFIWRMTSRTQNSLLSSDAFSLLICLCVCLNNNTNK